MTQLPFDPIKIFSMLSGALDFLNAYKSDTTPSILSSRYLATYQFTNKPSSYIPHNCSTIENQSLLALSLFKAHEATKNTEWKTLAQSVVQALTDYFFIDAIPATNNAIWLHHTLNVAYGTVKTEGSQSELNPFNYGNFDTVVEFTNGLGTLPSASNLSRVFKVYPIDSYLLFKNVYSNLNDSREFYNIEYYVINVNGSRFRIDASEVLTSTIEAEGTIKLTTNFTGQAKVTWCQTIGWQVNATSALSGQGLLENFPILSNPNKGSGLYYLNSSFRGFWNCYEAFFQAYNTLNDEKWLRAFETTKYTALIASNVLNNSYFYKKENNTNPFSYPGVYIKVNDARTLTGITATRETSATFKDFLKVVAVSTASRKIEIINDITQVNLTINNKLTLEASSSVNQVLEVAVNNSVDFSDNTQKYSAKRLVTSGLNNLELKVNDFVRWTTSTLWQPENSISTSVSNDATISVSYVQSIYNNSNQVVRRLSLNHGTLGTAIATVNIATTSSLPKIAYALDGQVNLILKDAGNNQFVTELPFTDGIWQELQLTADMFDSVPSNIVSINFASIQGTAVLDLFYIGANPVYLSPGIIYKASIIDREPSAHTLWLGTFKADSNSLEIFSYPGCLPANVQAIRSGSSYLGGNYRTGLVYVSSQSPYLMYKFNNQTFATSQINFLYDALIDYRNRTDIEGVLTPVFVPARWENASFTIYGSPQTNNGIVAYKYNEFSFSGFDPNATSFYSVCIAVENVAKYLQFNKSDSKAKTIVLSFLDYLNGLYTTNASIQPPTDVTSSGIQINYHNPAIAAVIGRAALYGNLAGIDARITINLIKNSYDYIVSNYVESGLMFGSWAKNQTSVSISSNPYKEYSSAYHSECILFLSELYLNRNILKYPYTEDPLEFPNLPPDSIDNFKLPEYKNSTIKFTDNEQTLILLDKPINSEITFKYSLIDAEKLDILLKFWKLQGGKAGSFALPDQIWKHPDLVTNAVNFQGSQWSFSDKLPFNVRVANKDRGLWNLEIKLKQVLAKTTNKELSIGIPDFSPDLPSDDLGIILTCPIGKTAQLSSIEVVGYASELGFGVYTIPESIKEEFQAGYKVFAKYYYSNNGSQNLCSFPGAYLGSGLRLNGVCLPYEYIYMGGDLIDLTTELFGYGTGVHFYIKLEGYRCL